MGNTHSEDYKSKSKKSRKGRRNVMDARGNNTVPKYDVIGRGYDEGLADNNGKNNVENDENLHNMGCVNLNDTERMIMPNKEQDKPLNNDLEKEEKSVEDRIKKSHNGVLKSETNVEVDGKKMSINERHDKVNQSACISVQCGPEEMVNTDRVWVDTMEQIFEEFGVDSATFPGK